MGEGTSLKLPYEHVQPSTVFRQTWSEMGVYILPDESEKGVVYAKNRLMTAWCKQSVTLYN